MYNLNRYKDKELTKKISVQAKETSIKGKGIFD
jgi:hypothetical protein